MIVVAGEALIDLVPQGGAADDGGDLPALAPRLGGGPFNTAVAVGRLGSPVAFCSRVSRDAFGEALLGGLARAGVDVSYVQRGDEPTTLAVASIAADGSAGYSFYVEGTADRLFSVPDRLPPGTRAVSFGTCSLVLEPGASAYEELMRSASAQGVFTALDPNIGPASSPTRTRTGRVSRTGSPRPACSSSPRRTRSGWVAPRRSGWPRVQRPS